MQLKDSYQDCFQDRFFRKKLDFVGKKKKSLIYIQNLNFKINNHKIYRVIFKSFN